MKILLPSQHLRALTGKLFGSIILTLYLTSCSSGSVDSAGPLPPATSYSGTLTSVTLTITDPSINPTGQATITAAVTFSFSVDAAGTLTGVVSISDTATNFFSGGPVTGTVTGSSINATITDGIAGAVNFSGTVTATNINGTYSRTGNITSTTETDPMTMISVTTFSGCPAHSGSIEAAA